MPPRSASPATMSCWSAIVEITGSGVSGSNSAELASSMPTERAASITMHCRPRHRPSTGNAVPARESDGADLALDAADAEAAGDQHAVHVVERRAAPGSVSQSSDATQRISTFARCLNPPARSASATDR